MSASESHPPIVGTPLVLHWADEEQTLAFARRLAARPALADAFIELRGELGAGKTTFVRHLLRTLGVGGRIKSPTYAVVEPYQVGPLAIWHFDFYRLADPREWEEAGFRDLFAGPGLKIAEWPEKAGAALPKPDLVLRIDTLDDDSRRVTATPLTPRGQELLA
nr:tRNA (adenosine(37)-N6)-threonylcarbamoyltransferase complex ATPase subunit type 1 TsaE [Ramlibacter aurantiacus]